MWQMVCQGLHQLTTAHQMPRFDPVSVHAKFEEDWEIGFSTIVSSHKSYMSVILDNQGRI